MTGVQTCALPIFGLLRVMLALVIELEPLVLELAARDGDVGELSRSEERRVGEECGSRGWAYTRKIRPGKCHCGVSENVEAPTTHRHR